MKPHNPPPPTYAFGYKNPPQPGSEINGLGVAEKVLGPARVSQRHRRGAALERPR
ncbi:MAG: hypothetical protein HC802_14275, partial [Caldilineaceae bacterium]|nr:hypothetical protein [Caldilineaceae bacterium]